MAEVIDPGLPFDMVYESIVTMGKTPLVVLVIKTSSAASKSVNLKSDSNTLKPVMPKILLLVTPARTFDFGV